MSREIKFRGMIAQGLENAGHWVYWGIGGTDMLDALDHETIGEYTGLKDMHGQEIYKGDVVEWDDGYFGKPSIRRAIVKIEPDIQYVLTLNTPTGRPMHVFHHGSFIYKDTHNHLEIIGNQYQNPELWEVRS